MRKLLFVAFPLLVFGFAAMAQDKPAAMAKAKPAAMAQGKIDTKWTCSKPSAEQKFDVGDMPDHTYGIAQGTCNATSSGTGFAEKTGQYTEFRETWKATMSLRGRFNSTLDNGDKAFYTYQQSGSTDPAKPMSNQWKIVNGTGKNKGMKGSGTCSGKANADGTGDWECKGTYSMGK
jgi:hypothetical protein